MASETLTVQVASQTDPSKKYTLHALGDVITCNCQGYQSHSHCKHQTALRAVLNEDQENMNETTALTKADAPPLPVRADPPPTALLPTSDELNAMMLIANRAVLATGMIPKNIETPDQALAIMLCGWELGMRPMTALRHVYNINGKTDIETRAMVGIIRARDPQIQFAWPEYTAEAVTCEIQRPGQQLVSVRYTLAEAKASGQTKNPVWTAYPRDMCYAAATKRACRIACPDLINAIESGMHQAAETTALMAPSLPNVRVIAPTADGEIPASAYNEGDDETQPLTPEVEVPDADAARGKIKDLILEAKNDWDRDSFLKLMTSANERYPVIFRNGAIQLSAIDDALAIEVATWFADEVHGTPPAVDVDNPLAEEAAE